MFYNISNHPSKDWSDLQTAHAGGEIVDVSFPNIPPTASLMKVQEIMGALIAEVNPTPHDTVMIQGEMCAVFVTLQMLKGLGVNAVHATTNRTPEGFKFVQFRPYF